MEDSKIISLFYDRSEQAIEELDHKYGSVVKKTAANILNDRLDAEESIPPEIFVLLDEAFRNRGYGTQCMKELLRIAVEEYGLHTVHGGCYKDNIASARAMEKAGMVLCGSEDNGDPRFEYTEE